MGIENNTLWVEKYRPKKIEDLVLDPSVRNLLNKFLTEGDIPHTILSGNVGCGKTTIAKILVTSLDCDYILLNASDERGIDTIRNKVKTFAMMSSIKKRKIVFLDEADALTPDALYSMRNLMETYSEQTRFILTCNYLNKIIDPIISRCQLIEFNTLQRKQIISLLEKILKQEEVKYDVDDLLSLIDNYYPDIRSMINNLQLYSKDGQWKLAGSENFRNLDQLIPLIKSKSLDKIRELEIDYVEAYCYLFDKVDEITDNYSKRVELSLEIADFLWKDTFIADKSINFAACMLNIVEKLK